MTDSPSRPDDQNLTTRYEPEADDSTPAEPPPPPAATAPSPPPPLPPAPTWRQRRGDPGRTGTIIFGVILVAVGLWFVADQTLELDMPRLRWSELWPLLIIALGGWIVLGSMRRG
jgi:hypothetical protein